MVGCWFAGQGKKGDCVGKKVNGGPVTRHNQIEFVLWIFSPFESFQLMKKALTIFQATPRARATIPSPHLSQAFPIPHSSSTSVYHCQHKPKNRKNVVGLGTRLGQSKILIAIPTCLWHRRHWNHCQLGCKPVCCLPASMMQFHIDYGHELSIKCLV